MTFRSNEEQDRGYRMAVDKLLGRYIDAAARPQSRIVLDQLIEKYGPVVDCYPHWHPIVAANQDSKSPVIAPSERCGYRGLDHTVYLRNGFITCPYSGADNVIQAVEEIDDRDATNGIAKLSAEKIDAQLYHSDAKPVLVTCEWKRPMNRDGTIPTKIAVPMILERELPAWRYAEVAETWKTMRTYFLGQPAGSRSSLFVNEETGQIIKKIWNELINTGMYGPIYVG